MNSITYVSLSPLSPFYSRHSRQLILAKVFQSVMARVTARVTMPLSPLSPSLSPLLFLNVGHLAISTYMPLGVPFVVFDDPVSHPAIQNFGRYTFPGLPFCLDHAPC